MLNSWSRKYGPVAFTSRQQGVGRWLYFLASQGHKEWRLLFLCNNTLNNNHKFFLVWFLVNVKEEKNPEP